MNDRELRKLAAIVKINPDELTDASEIDLAGWDSVEVLELIAAIDEAYGVTIPLASMNKCRNAGELRTLIEGAQG
jgi:acyl carrier protein